MKKHPYWETEEGKTLLKEIRQQARLILREESWKQQRSLMMIQGATVVLLAATAVLSMLNYFAK